MPEATHYTQLTRARLDERAWEEAFYALTALKGVLQSLPGFVGMELLGRAEAEVELVIIVRWALEEQLAAWLRGGETPAAVLAQLEPAPKELSTQALLELG